jgi:hypothetical protein
MVTLIRWFGLGLLFLGTLEAAARLEDWVRYRTPFLSPYRDQSELVVRDRDGSHGRPGARYMKWTINNLGMRGPDAPAQPSASTIRVITVGASETFGLYEAPNREYPRQLEDSLAAQRPGACKALHGSRFEVLNAAMPGMSLPTIHQDVQRRLPRLKPQIIVVYPTPVQYLADNPPVASALDTTSVPAPIPWTQTLYPRTLDRARAQLKQVLPAWVQTQIRRTQTARDLNHHPTGWRFEVPPAERMALYERDLRTLVGGIRSIGAIPILATHANAFKASLRHDATLMVMWEKFYPRADGETIVAFDSIGRIATLGVAHDSAVRIIDLAEALQNSSLFRDYAHFTDEGSARVAAALAPAVNAAGGEVRGCPPDQGLLGRGDLRTIKKTAIGMARSAAGRRHIAAIAASKGDPTARSGPRSAKSASPLKRPSPQS